MGLELERMIISIRMWAIAGLALMITSGSWAQTHDYQEESAAYRRQLSDTYKSGENKVLKGRQLKEFGHLNFYEFDPAFVVEARFEALSNDEVIQVATSTDRMGRYTKYGYLHFELKGKPFKLLVLESPSLKDDPEYYNYLSVFFTDQTNGHGSYKMGRYMELRSPLKEPVMLNFNNTYNPYCAYSERFSCPIPPKENHLEIKVTAGVKEGFKRYRRF